MNRELDVAIDAANERLTLARVGVRIQVRGKGDWLYLRATLPPKDAEAHRPFQQRITTGIAAIGLEAIAKVEATALKLGAQLNLGEFRWDDWVDRSARVTVGHYLAQLERNFWERNDRSRPASLETWRVGYWSVLKTLPAGKELTEDLLKQWIPARDAGGTHREHYVARANELAKLAGLSISFSNVPRIVTARSLPSEERLIELYNSAAGTDQWVLGALIAYGLRPHELFGLDYGQYPQLTVRKSAKTGSRVVVPIYPSGCKWDLSVYRLPATWEKATRDQDWLRPTKSNSKLGTKVTQLFKRRGWGMVPYDARHCFGRRCKQFGLDEYLTAKLMGHTERVHKATYQSSFGDRFVLDLVKKQLGH